MLSQRELSTIRLVWRCTRYQTQPNWRPRTIAPLMRRGLLTYAEGGRLTLTPEGLRALATARMAA